MPKPRKSRRTPRAKGNRGPPAPPSPAPAVAPLRSFPKVGPHQQLSLLGEDPEAIRQVSCQRGFLAVVRAPRTVVVLHQVEDGDLQSLSGKPRHIQLEKTGMVNSLDSDASHLLILSSNGELSEHSIAGKENKPRLLKELRHKPIVQIACGEHHSMALSKGGELFAWGHNEHGQLGVGKEIRTTKEPQLVQTLEGIPLAQIAAGSSHSMALSVFGTVHAWGKNRSGQLGLGDAEDRYVPAEVKALELKKTVFISCGEEHTAVLLKDGLVCTFGAGCHGQLGHNSTRRELFPRLVAELWGTQVTQVACGKWHTLVYSPALGEIYSFGSGEEGQLGEGRKKDQLVPLPLNLNPHGSDSNCEESTERKVVKIIAGGNQSIVLHLKEKNAYTKLNQMLATVDEKKIDWWVSHSNSNYWKEIKGDIQLIFSSAACLNGSFRVQRGQHFRTPQEAAVVDMSAVLLVFNKIVNNPRVFTQVIKTLKRLLHCLPHAPTSPEALRVFLIVPSLLQKQELRSDHLLSRLAQVIWALPEKSKQVLETLWSNLEVAFFKDLVTSYQRVVDSSLSSFKKRPLENFIHVPLRVLQMLYVVNCRAGVKIQESNFYIPEIIKMLSFPDLNDIQNWMQTMSQKTIDCMLLFLLAQFPCIFAFEGKIKMLRADCTYRHLLSIMTNASTFHELRVRRQHLLQDTWHHIRTTEEAHFQQLVMVHFEGELGIDDGALSQEFFTIISRELCRPEAQIFKHFEDSHCIWFSREESTFEDTYFFIGNLFGMALYNMKIAAFPFPLALFKKLAGIEPTLEDMKELSPTIGRTLQAVLDERRSDILENMMLDFVIMEERKGSITEVELKENGANIPVALWNRKEYVDAFVNYTFNDSVKKQYGDFMRGFFRGCPSTFWTMLLPVELRVVLLGHTTYNWEQLEKNAFYYNFDKSDETIVNFWTVFHDLHEEKKKNFLAFLTGSDRIPAQGMDRFSFTIQDANKENPDLWFPAASTCFRILYLPRYTDRHILKKRFLVAIENFEKFGLP